MPIPIRTPEEIDRIAQAGRVVRDCIDFLCDQAAPGLRTRDLDALASEFLEHAGASSLLRKERNARGVPFPGSVSVNIDEEALHATPSDRILRAGSVVSIDLAASVDGWCADAARSVVIGEQGGRPERAARLVASACRCLHVMLDAMAPGVPWSNVVTVLTDEATRLGVQIASGCHGHGIGRQLHDAPVVRHTGVRPGSDGDFVLRPGMVLTVEPIVLERADGLVRLDDGWTEVTADRSWACHEERTVCVNRHGVRVLTGGVEATIGG